jgi:hypothetical protein
MMNVRFDFFALTVLGAVAACTAGSDRSSDAAPVTRDSAGITIVDNSAVDPARMLRWTVDTAPAFVIGTTAGDSAYEFASIGDVHQLPNGMIVVLSGQGEAAFEFRFYDSTGKHIVTHGRMGQGPGEYQWVNFFGSVGGDTLMGVDFHNSRISWLSASKGYLRGVRLDENGFRKVIGTDAYGIVETMVPLGDSVYAVKAYRSVPNASLHEQHRQTYHIVDLAAGTAINLGPYDDPPKKAVKLSTGGNNYMSSPDAGDPARVVDRERGRMCAVVTNATEIVCIERNGKRSHIRWRDDVVPYTAEDGREDEKAWRERLKGSRLPPQDIATLVAARETPKRHQPIAAFELDTDGNFWILEPTLDSAKKRQSRFRIIAPDGRQIAFADPFPTGHIRVDQPLHIGSTSVLRVIETPDGAPAIGVFRIRKPD